MSRVGFERSGEVGGGGMAFFIGGHSAVDKSFG
jgi:hypothetical protein